MSSFPCLVRFMSGSGQVRYRLGDQLIDRYLEFVAGRCRPYTLRAAAIGQGGPCRDRAQGTRARTAIAASGVSFLTGRGTADQTSGPAQAATGLRARVRASRNDAVASAKPSGSSQNSR